MSSPAPTISYPESTIPRPLWEYVAHIRISVDELRDLQAAPAASVRVFLGSPPSGPTEWPTAVNLAGAFHVKVPVNPRSVIGRNVSPRIGWRDRGHASEAVEGSGGRYNAIIPDLGDKAEASAGFEDGNTHSANREGSKGNISEGYVHLNAAISRHFQPGLFNPEVVVPYLTKTLQWRVQKVCIFLCRQILP